MAWLPGYAHRKAIPLTGGPDGALTDYQLKLAVAFVTDHMQSDFDDLRFTKEDGETLIDAWLEAKVDGTSADVWVKFPSTPANGVEETKGYMYYGKVDALSDWDGDATFEFFDDFDDGTLDTTKWTVNSGTEDTDFWEENGYLKVIGNAGTIPEIIGTKLAYPLIFEHRAKFSSTLTNLLAIGVVDIPGTNDFVLYTYNSNGNARAYARASGSITWISGGSALPGQDSWQTYKFEWLDTPSAKVFYDNTQFGSTATTNIPSINMGAYIRGYTSGSGELYVDWTRARKYAANPPTYEFGSEESVPTGAAPTSIFYGPLVGPFGGPI